MLSGIGEGFPQISEVPGLVLLKVRVADVVPSTITKKVLLGHESILYTLALMVREL